MSKRSARGRRSKSNREAAPKPGAGAPRAAEISLAKAMDAHQRGDLAAAEAGYRACLRLAPGHAEATHNLALVRYAGGDPAGAASLLRELLEALPGELRLQLVMGQALRDAGELEEAESVLRDLTGRRSPDMALRLDAAYALGTVLHEQGRLEEACTCYQDLLTAHPRHAAAWNSLGTAQIDREALEDALEALTQALRIQPRHLGALINRGRLLGLMGRPEEGFADLDRALALKSNLPEAHSHRATLLLQAGRPVEAIRACRAALALRPGHPDLLFKLSSILLEQGELKAARAALEQCLEAEPNRVSALVALANVEVGLRQPGRARALTERALELAPDHAAALGTLGSALAVQGDHEAARINFERAIALDASRASTWLMLIRSGGLREVTEERLDQVAELARSAEPGSRAAATWGFVQGDLSHAAGRCSEAFVHYSRGNRIVQSFAPYDRVASRSHLEAVARVLGADFFTSRTSGGDPTELPVFVLGMPRSGTSLVEQILSSHPQVAGGGEMPAVPGLVADLSQRAGPGRTYVDLLPGLGQDEVSRLASELKSAFREVSADAARVTDKLPANYLDLGLIALLFPNARVVHCRRDPMDVCLSNFMQLYGEGHEYAYDLSDLAFAYRVYHALIAHWKAVLPLAWYEVTYEALIDDQETLSRELIDFCGLDWDDRCLRFQRNRREVTSASHWQVRQPLYRGALARWKRYEPQLAGLKTSLAAVLAAHEAGCYAPFEEQE